MKMDKYQARIDAAESTAAELESAIKTLQAEVSKLDAELSEASVIRNQEHEEYLKASKDFSDSQHAVASAIAVLRDYYAGAFIQMKAVASTRTSGARQPSFGGSQKDTSSSILGIMEVTE